jgi:hypothetical protein
VINQLVLIAKAHGIDPKEKLRFSDDNKYILKEKK